MKFSLRRALAAAAVAAVTGAGALAAQAPAAPAPPQVTIGGVTYSQFLYQLKDTANHVNTFNVTRAYLNAVGRFSGGVYTRVTSDVFTSGTSLALRLKYAYVAYTPGKSILTYKFGLIHTPWLDWEEALWDYRMQGAMSLDRSGYLTSADFGAGIDGNYQQDRVNGQVTLVNGEGYGGGPGDQRKDFQARLSVRVMNTDDNSRVGGLRVSGYAGIGKPTGGGTRNRFLGMASYRSKEFTLAAEFASMKDTNTAVTVAQHTERMISAFGVFHVPNSKVAVIARVDLYDPNTGVAGDHQTRIIGGVSYQLSPNLRLLADVDNLTYEGGSPSPAAEAVRSQALFQTQFTF
jgi:hypothetical protein